jgi:hypothetical protein
VVDDDNKAFAAHMQLIVEKPHGVVKLENLLYGKRDNDIVINGNIAKDPEVVAYLLAVIPKMSWDEIKVKRICLKQVKQFFHDCRGYPDLMAKFRKCTFLTEWKKCEECPICKLGIRTTKCKVLPMMNVIWHSHHNVRDDDFMDKKIALHKFPWHGHFHYLEFTDSIMSSTIPNYKLSNGVVVEQSLRMLDILFLEELIKTLKLYAREEKHLDDINDRYTFNFDAMKYCTVIGFKARTTREFLFKYGTIKNVDESLIKPDKVLYLIDKCPRNVTTRCTHPVVPQTDYPNQPSVVIRLTEEEIDDEGKDDEDEDPVDDYIA